MNIQIYLTFWGFVLSPTICFGRDVQSWLESPIVTSWGDWGAQEICPDKTFVGAFILKVEGNVRGRDDTALNGVMLLCIDLDEAREQDQVHSTIGEFGDWRGRKNCNNGLATGFKFRSESDQRGGDDVAGVDMALFCTNSDGSQDEIVGSGLHDWGSWTAEQHCPAKTAICGIQTQVEGSQRGGKYSKRFLDFKKTEELTK